MRNFKKWMEGKPPFLTIVAFLLATDGVEVLPILLTKLKRGERFALYDVFPEVKYWLRLYRDHRHVVKVVREHIREWGEVEEKGVEIISTFMDGLRYLEVVGIDKLKKQLKGMNVEEMRENLKKAREYWDEFFDLLMDDHESTEAGEIDEELGTAIIRMFKKPEWEFYSRVWLVCSFFYGEHPAQLMRKARLGYVDAMEKLMRLDKAVISDEKIAGHLNRFYWEKKATYDRLINALRGGVKIKTTTRKIKYFISGLISQLSIVLGHTLNEPEIRELFNAISRDQGRGLEDTDLVEGSDDFRRAISRERVFWARVAVADNK
jgi:hypothetical protein